MGSTTMAKRQGQVKNDGAIQRDSTDRAMAGARTKRTVVALTGACSFLGTNLIGLLEEDQRVSRIVALDIRAPATAGAKTHYYEVDFTQPASEERMAEIFTAERVQTLAHVAFLANPTHATAWAHEFESVGTMHVLNAARQAQVHKLVHWSQTVLYGARRRNPNFLAEDHPLHAQGGASFFQDKIEAEAEAIRFAQRTDTVVTVLRTAPILGPTARNYVVRYLSKRLVPTLMGYDPLWQFVHEVDAVAAFKLAIDRDVPGTFNIVSDGVLPLSTVIRLAGRLAIPVPHPLAFPVAGALWAAQLSDTPP
ncbi:MAG: NAD-dependent epimerase/dehydratase family protein, partial [Polyangiaceae bacterium]|nr:NAD-dependent epimerase/dehydratase family protein [Polyangiaceae bacterium]